MRVFLIKANSTLLSNANNFKVATDYYSGTDPYWGARAAEHHCSSTIYNWRETTIPSLDFVVRGKGVGVLTMTFLQRILLIRTITQQTLISAMK